jgi:hypothetical protein
MKGM